MPKRAPWYSILLAARKLVEKGQLTSLTLSDKVDFPINFASAWLRKFERWGYVRRIGKTSGSGRGRPAILWEMTKYGNERRAPTRSNQPNVDKFVERRLRIAANPPGNQG